MWPRAMVFKKKGFKGGDSSPSLVCDRGGVGSGKIEGVKQRGRETERKQMWQMLTIINLSKGHIDVHVHLFCGFKFFQNKKLGK